MQPDRSWYSHPDSQYQHAPTVGTSMPRQSVPVHPDSQYQHAPTVGTSIPRQLVPDSWYQHTGPLEGEFKEKAEHILGGIIKEKAQRIPTSAEDEEIPSPGVVRLQESEPERSQTNLERVDRVLVPPVVQLAPRVVPAPYTLRGHTAARCRRSRGSSRAPAPTRSLCTPPHEPASANAFHKPASEYSCCKPASDVRVLVVEEGGLEDAGGDPEPVVVGPVERVDVEWRAPAPVLHVVSTLDCAVARHRGPERAPSATLRALLEAVQLAVDVHAADNLPPPPAGTLPQRPGHVTALHPRSRHTALARSHHTAPPRSRHTALARSRHTALARS
eukprot:3547262-Rhodomonas_salina.1